MNELESMKIHQQVRIPQSLPRPVSTWICCQNLEKGETILKSGLALPKTNEYEDIAAVLAVGPGSTVISDGKPIRIPLQVRPGDIVRTSRKKGRTAHLETAESGGKARDFYNLYQENEVIMVEYHSKLLAERLSKLQQAPEVDY